MNTEYLGDALDHWKGCLFEYLQSEHALLDFGVDAMATDPNQWGEADYELYARLLRVKREQIIPHQARLFPSRDEYFAEIARSGDVFLDPDTGIGHGAPIEKYVKPKELVKLLRVDSSRTTAVYQHVRGKTASVCVDDQIAKIEPEVESLGWCSYESPSVAMIFLCSERKRTDEIARALGKLLGHHASRRVRSNGTSKLR